MLYKSGRHPDGPMMGPGLPMSAWDRVHMLSQVACHPVTHIFGNHNFAKRISETTCNGLGN